jgi:hypothetical protein
VPGQRSPAGHPSGPDLTPHDEPLLATLARVAARERWLAVHPQVPLGEPGWRCAADLLDRPAGLAEVVQEAATALAVEHPSAGVAVRRTVAAGLLLVDWSWALAALGAGSLAHDRRVPELAPETVWLRWTDGRVAGIALTSRAITCAADDPAAGSTRATVAEDLEAVLRTELQRHLIRLHAALRGGDRPLLRLGPRTVWGAAGDGVATALRLQAGGCPDAAGVLAVAEQVLAGAPRSWGRAGFVPAGGGQVTRRRTSCCLYYRLPDTAPCVGCPRLASAAGAATGIHVLL